ncbi:helix-turn-helix domain-containing protein (plasmid) [Microtetraspora malaysiensis]|uniref:helix-turn-helix domain-containing protein n=1 Tax=Microtetraspora malaysiensis TaxID=161358 RepID=UPI003D8F56DE
MSVLVKKNARVVGEERARLGAELRKRYEAGETVRELASSTGRSYGFVHQVLSEAGVKLRSRGGAFRKKEKAAAAA